MTPRERDPAVWAATYAAFFVRTLDSAYSAADGSTPDERMAAALPMVDPAACSRIADAAVNALHPEDTSAGCPDCNGLGQLTGPPGTRADALKAIACPTCGSVPSPVPIA